jgi:hypothetical protein
MSEMLMRMNTKDLASLAQTVTSRLIIPETSGEAVTAILLHTDRPTGETEKSNCIRKCSLPIGSSSVPFNQPILIINF